MVTAAARTACAAWQRSGTRLRTIIVLATALLASRAAPALEICTCQNQSFEWLGCRDDAAHCDDGGWSGCDASPDDVFLIQSGCHVEVGPGADVLLEALPDRAMDIHAGGKLSVRGPVEWRVRGAGLRANPGSDVSFQGCYRNTSGSECTEALDPDSLFPIGSIRPCRGGDCSDDPELVRIEWAAGQVVAGVPYATIHALLGHVDAVRDVLCFWQYSEAGYVGADAGYCYKITSAGTDETGSWLEFDIRQVWGAQSDQAGYPLARRRVQEGTLLGDHRSGSRTVKFAEDTLVQGRTDQMGRWLRCGGMQRAYLIASVEDDPGGDELFLADARGQPAWPSGTRCHIDWGWSLGDVAFVMAPVHVTSAVNETNAAFVRLEGTASLSAVVVDGLGGDSSNRGALQLRGPVDRFEHVWVTDPLVGDGDAVSLQDVPCDTAIGHLTITGGPPDPEDDQSYGLVWFGGSECSYTVSHLYTRFRADDNFVLESTGAQPVGAIDLHYVHAGPSSAPGDSGQLFDFGRPNPSDVTAADVLCTACTSQDGRGSLIGPSHGTGVLSDLLWVGAFNGGWIAHSAEADNPDFHFQRAALIGAAVDAANAKGAGPLMGLSADEFYVRDVFDPRPGSSRLCVDDTTHTRDLRRGIFASVELGQLPCAAGSDAHLEDVYFIDVTRTGVGGSLLEVQTTATNVVLERVTMGFSRPPLGISRGIQVLAGAAPGLRLDGPLLAGFRGPGVMRAMQVGSAAAAMAIDWGAPTCFWQNGVDDAPASLAAYGTAPVQGQDPLFVAPAAQRFATETQSFAREVGCGARRAGFSRMNWAHRKAKLLPMVMVQPPSCGLLGVEALPLLGWFAARAHRRRRVSPGDSGPS